MEDFEEASSVNSELRFLTIELMKIAVQQNRTFDDVLAEYFDNAYKLKRRLLLQGSGVYRLHKAAARR
ncbi:MAG: hypothetical protein V1787_04610 [Candidatus Micrarchaeota archaeon]